LWLPDNGEAEPQLEEVVMPKREGAQATPTMEDRPDP
jgi:hypothetical protein